jgi:hypothetical protein
MKNKILSFLLPKYFLLNSLSRSIFYTESALTVNGVILEEVNQVGNFVEVINGSDSELVGLGDSCAEHETADSSESVDTELD